MISFSLGGSTKRTSDFLQKAQNPNAFYSDLANFAERGVTALRDATPKDTGLTADSWGYEITINNSQVSIAWLNSNNSEDVNVAVLLQYGHGTGTGGYVTGKDYINPSIKPIFDEIADSVWKKVSSA